jgi:ubiquinone/menaquinone biosynthesis C-methylase UbiE
VGPHSADWYHRAFSESYRLIYPHRDDEAGAREVSDLLNTLALAVDSPMVLDVGCGTGRHAVALAEAGLRIIGVDLSTELLGTAAIRPALKGRLVTGDMRCLPFTQTFRLVVSLFTSFGYFEDDQNVATLREMARVLVPGGVIVVDHVNAERLEKELVAHDRRVGHGYVVDQRRRIQGRRVRKNITVTRDDGSTEEFVEDVRLYRPHELAALMRVAGFRDVRYYGSYAGTPYDTRSDRMIAVAWKRA